MNIKKNTFEEAFLEVNKRVLTLPDYQLHSRNGKCNEILNLSYEVSNPLSYKFENQKINRISYDYGEVFYEFMLTGGTDAIEAFKDYPNVIPFIEKPKSPALPDNFNTLYGPRIKIQLDKIINELKNNLNSRRATLLILEKEDANLYNSDETIEYPCTISMSYFIRDNKLNCICNMRSQNTGVVMQLDMYLQGRVLEHIANKLNIKIGKFYANLASAHLFERDFDYIRGLI